MIDVSEEKEEITLPSGGPAVRIEMQGEQFLAPLLLPKEFREKNFYQGSCTFPLGNFSLGHQIFQWGCGWRKAWIGRIFSDNIKEKIMNDELFAMVIGQSSRAREALTLQSLTKQISEIITTERKSKKSFLDKLLGR